MAVNTEFGNINAFDCTGSPSSVGPRWKRWKRSFDFFLEAKDITKDSQRKSPAEGDTLYAKAMRSLDAHFLPQVNVPFQRHHFRQANQEESETADQFDTRLFQLAENCNFGTAKEENIRDQLIDKCRSHDLRKKLLGVSGKLTL